MSMNATSQGTATRKMQDRTWDPAGVAMRMMEGGASRMAEEAAEAFAIAGVLTQHVMQTVLDLEAHAGQETARCLSEQQRTDVDVLRELQEVAFRWQTTWPEMMRDPLRWYLHALEQNTTIAQKWFVAMRQNAEAMTQCLRRME